MVTRAALRRLFLIVMFGLVAASTVSLAATVTSNADNGAGTLRDAIAAAAPGETIDFSITGTIALSTELAINKNLTIAGPGAQDLTIQSGGTRVFSVAFGNTVTISGLTITGSTFGSIGGPGGAGGDGADGGTTGGLGGLGGLGGPGAGGQGGGILNHGSLTVVEVAFRNNGAFGGIGGSGGAGGNGGLGSELGGTGGNGGNGGFGGGGHGGAIFNDGTLTVLRSEFSSNNVFGGIGGSGGDGGDGGNVDTGGEGVGTGGTGGVGGTGGFGESGRGAGLFNSGTATVIDSTFDGNNSNGGIGGPGGSGGAGGDEVAVETAAGGAGGAGGDGGDGGMGSAAIDNVGTLTLTFVTTARNSTGDGNGGPAGVGGAGGIGTPDGADGSDGTGGSVAPAFGANLAQSGVATVSFSILASPAAGVSCTGAFLSGGYNVTFGDASCDASLVGTGDLPGADPVLQPLALNPPGTTRTDAIVDGSAAQDIVPAGVCVAAANVDQRNLSRPQGSACDAGAFELFVAPSVVEVPTLSELGVAIFAALLTCAALLALRHRAG